MKVKEYLTFTKRERNGILALIAIMMVVVFTPQYFCQPARVEPEIVDEVNKAFSDTSVDTSAPKAHVNHNYSARRDNHNRNGPHVYKQKTAPFEINTADTTKFIALPGIGSRLAARIVTFREKLGGFYDVKQIGEVYGLQDSVFKKISPFLKCDASKVQRININEAGKDALGAHPYIRWNIADAVIAYRDQHGHFSSSDDLLRIENIDAGVLERIRPYLSFK